MTAPVKIEIDLDLDQYLVRFHGYDEDGEERVEPQTLEDIVLEQATRHVVAKIGQEKLYQSHRERIMAIRDEVIREKITSVIEDALAGPLVKTNSYGEPTGQSTTLREVIMQEVGKALTVASRDNGFGNPPKTVVQEFIAKQVRAEVDKELRAALDAAKAEVVGAVRGQAAAVITQTITNLAGVR